MLRHPPFFSFLYLCVEKQNVSKNLSPGRSAVWGQTSIHIFIPCHRKNSQSECKKAAVYSKVLHPPSHCALRVSSVFGKSKKKKSESACQNMNMTTFSKMTSPNVICDCSIWAVRIPNFGPSDCSGIASEFSFSSLDQFAKHVVSKKIQWYFLQQR